MIWDAVVKGEPVAKPLGKAERMPLVLRGDRLSLNCPLIESYSPRPRRSTRKGYAVVVKALKRQQPRNEGASLSLVHGLIGDSGNEFSRGIPQ